MAPGVHVDGCIRLQRRYRCSCIAVCIAHSSAADRPVPVVGRRGRVVADTRRRDHPARSILCVAGSALSGCAQPVEPARPDRRRCRLVCGRTALGPRVRRGFQPVSVHNFAKLSVACLVMHDSLCVSWAFRVQSSNAVIAQGHRPPIRFLGCASLLRGSPRAGARR